MTVTTDLLFFAPDPTHGREPWGAGGSFNINLVKDINRARDE
jgi:ELWxxDGT repeat protein